MKKLTLVLVSVAILIAAGLATLAVIYKYENVQAEKAQQVEQQRAEINKTVAEAKWQLEDANAVLKADYNRLHAECLKGASAYPLLTTANKTRVEVPACGSAK